MKFQRCVAVGGIFLFAYSLTGPALAEAIRVSHERIALELSSADRPAFDLSHTHFDVESEPVPSTIAEIAVTGRQVSASAGIPFESLRWV